MRLSASARYAVWLMLEIARQEDQQAVSIRNISKTTKISNRYLGKLVISLKKASLLKGKMGRAGGYTLTRPATQIPIRQIIEAVLGPINIVECVHTPLACPKAEICECRWLYATINDRVRGVLAQLTLADLTGEAEPTLGSNQIRGTGAACPLIHKQKTKDPARSKTHGR